MNIADLIPVPDPVRLQRILDTEGRAGADFTDDTAATKEMYIRLVAEQGWTSSEIMSRLHCSHDTYMKAITPVCGDLEKELTILQLQAQLLAVKQDCDLWHDAFQASEAREQKWRKLALQGVCPTCKSPDPKTCLSAIVCSDSWHETGI